jgi:aminoglycoside 6-adenylyltransferase
LELPSERDVLARLVAWGQADAAIRALILTSNRARPDGGADLLSDYDVIVAVRDAEQFTADAPWTREYGAPMAGWGDESEVLGLPTFFRGVIHSDRARIDYTIWPVELLRRVGTAETLPDNLDVGYSVLLDKDGATTNWPPATYRAHIPTPPTQEKYDALVHEFRWDTTYVAKALWRGELFFAKFVFESEVKGVALRRMLEWRVELDHEWSLKSGAYGRGLERLLPPEVWAELATTYVGVDPDENWDALFRITSLFQRVAVDVAGALGLVYRQQDDDGVTAYLEAIRNLAR